MAYVNLWELITFAADHGEHHAEKCKAIQAECTKGAFSYMQEVSLEVTDHDWKVKLFSCGESPESVEVSVDKRLNVTVKRIRDEHNVLDTREIRF